MPSWFAATAAGAAHGEKPGIVAKSPAEDHHCGLRGIAAKLRTEPRAGHGSRRRQAPRQSIGD